MTLIDSFYYGRLVITPVNHIVYNLFSSHGPTLYGRKRIDGLTIDRWGKDVSRKGIVVVLREEWIVEFQSSLSVGIDRNSLYCK